MSKLPFEITDKVKADFKATLDFWDAARKSNNSILKKSDWKEFKRIEYQAFNCAFCKYFGALRKLIICPYCPLIINNISCLDGSYFIKWEEAESLDEKVIYAEKIYQFIKSWCDKNIFNQEGAE